MKLYNNLENNFVSQTPYNGFQERHVGVTNKNALAFFQTIIYLPGVNHYIFTWLSYGVGSLENILVSPPDCNSLHLSSCNYTPHFKKNWFNIG